MTTVSGTPPTSPHSPRIDSTSARSWLRRRSVRVASLVSLSLIASLTMTSPARAETSLVPVQVSGIAAVLQSELVADAPHTEVVIETDQGQALPLPATNPLTDVDATTHFTVTLAVPRSVVEQVLGQAPAQVDDPDQANSIISRLNQQGQTVNYSSLRGLADTAAPDTTARIHQVDVVVMTSSPNPWLLALSGNLSIITINRQLNAAFDYWKRESRGIIEDFRPNVNLNHLYFNVVTNPTLCSTASDDFDVVVEQAAASLNRTRSYYLTQHDQPAHLIVLTPQADYCDPGAGGRSYVMTDFSSGGINRISVPSQGDWSEIVTHELRHSFGLQHEAVADPETCQAESWDSFHPGSPCQLSPSGDYVDAQDGTLNGRYKAQLGIINPNLGSTDLTFRADNTISNRQFTLVETRTPDRAALQSLHVIDSTEPGDKEYYIDYDARVDGVRVFRIPRSNDPDTAAFPLGDQTWRPDYISLWADRDRFGLQAGECRELASGNVSVRIEQIDDQGARLSLGSGPCQGLDSLSLSFPEGTLPADGAETELTVTTSSPDLAWKLFSYDDSWLTLSPNSGVGSGQVKVTATYNSHISERRSKILLASAANPVTSTSRDSVTVIQSGRPLIDPQKVTVKGTPITGQTLSAVTKPWSPVNIRLSYQWLRQNPAGLPINIPGATAATYTVTEADAGYRLSVVVTGQIDFVPAVHQQSLWTDLAANGNCVSFLKLFMICNTTAGKISLKPV